MHVQPARPVPPAPHGHGFAAMTSWNRLGRSTDPQLRDTRHQPDSSGSRSASSTSRENSGASSMKRTPWCARDSTPTLLGRELPSIAAVVVRWCGVSYGGSGGTSWAEKVPASEASASTSTAARSSNGGRRPGRQPASRVFPAPGAPVMRRWWAPAAAISSAKRASSCPWTTARSCTCGRWPWVPVRSRTTSTGGAAIVAPQRTAHSATLATGSTCAPGTSRASSAQPAGTAKRVKPARSPDTIVGSTPGTGTMRPSSPSSPQKTTPRVSSGSTTRSAPRIAIAIARSKPLPTFRTLPGASDTVYRIALRRTPRLLRAARMRFRDSLTEASGRPTTSMPGIPGFTLASTATAVPSSPDSAIASARPSSTGRISVAALIRAPRGG